MGPSAIPPVSGWKLTLILAIVSFATVAFVLCLFRLLSFFIMPSLFFDLLFIGFPIGAFIGARYFSVSVRDFFHSLVALQIVMLLSIGLCLACKHADYLRATFYDLETSRLFAQMGIFSGLFLPFFCAYGFSEYLGYRVGSTALRRRMPAVYAIYLLGAALAYLAIHAAVPWLGIARIMFGSVALVVAASLLLRRASRLLAAELVLLLAALAYPKLEAQFLNLYKGSYHGASITSTKGITQSGDWQPIYQRWGRYSLCELMESPGSRQITAFYNDVFQWAYNSPYGIPHATLDALPFVLIPEGGRAAIIGSGGGRQVRWGRLFKRLQIVAIELEPEVFRMTRNVHAAKFDRVYEEPEVTPVCREGRRYLTDNPDPFDLIFLPSVGGYPQMMLEPGNMIRTLEAYQLMIKRLKPGGILAIWYPSGLDPRGILSRQYLDTFRMLGLHTFCYASSAEVLILASNVRERLLLSESSTLAFFRGEVGPFQEPTAPELVPAIIPYQGDPSFTPITDDKPFLGGNIRHIFSIEQVRWIFGLLALAIGSLGLVAAILLRRRGDPQVPGISYTQIVLISVLVGANFLIMEHALVIALFRVTFVFADALTLGAVAFLILTGLGSILLGGHRHWMGLIVCAASSFALLVGSYWLPPMGSVGLIVPAAFALGSFFPFLFEASKHNPLVVFAMDAFGSALGALSAFFIPIVFGLSRVLTVAAGVAVCTSLAMAVFLRRIRSNPRQPVDELPSC
jgi:spermidine synthase